MEIKIVIPTYHRAGNITTLKVISPVILCVAKSELSQYREHHPDVEIVTHPDSVIGLALKRQFIYDYFGDVLMLDYDISHARRLYPMSGTKKATELDPDEAYEIVQWCGNTASLTGCYLFGFNKVPNPIIYDPLRPIQMSGLVTGCAIGLLRVRVSGTARRVSPLRTSGLLASTPTITVRRFSISGLISCRKKRSSALVGLAFTGRSIRRRMTRSFSGVCLAT